MSGAAALPPLVAVTSKVSPRPENMYMCTNNVSMTVSEYKFLAANGGLLFRVENRGSFLEKKVLHDGHGNVLLVCKKFPLSLAKWSICTPDGTVVAKTRTIAGMVKYGLEVVLPSRSSKPLFMVAPDTSLSRVMMWQCNGKNKEDTPLCEAAYGDNVVMGMVSAAVQDWSYHLSLDPGADAALVCCLLAIYTGLVEWNALGGAFGM